MARITITANETCFFVLLFFIFHYLYSSAILLSTIVLSVFLLKRKEIYLLWSVLAPRVTGSAPFLVFLLQFAREEGPGDNAFPDLLELKIPFLSPIFVIFKDSYVKRILQVEPENFPSRGFEGPMVNFTGSGNNILLSSGPPNPHWRRYRKISSQLNKDKIGENSLQADLFNISWKVCEELSLKIFSNQLSHPVDVFLELHNLIIPTHNCALFGEEQTNKYSYKELNSDIYDTLYETGKLLSFNFCTPNKKDNFFYQLGNILKSIFNMAKCSSSPFMKPLLTATKEGELTEEELESNVMVFEYAQAPLHAIFWLLYVLALYPREEEKLFAEIKNSLSFGPLTYTGLSNLKFLDLCVKEILRLYPGVAVMQARKAAIDLQFGGHYVPSGSTIIISQFLNHRNGSYWTNPDDFSPSREGINCEHSNNFSYIPFGRGPRQCQGQFFAITLVKVAVISILLHFKLSLVPGQKVSVPTNMGYLRPERPVYFHFEKRV